MMDRCGEARFASIHPNEDSASIEIQQVDAAIAIQVRQKAALRPITIRIWTGNSHELTLVPAQLS
jgi:hypothetical protein